MVTPIVRSPVEANSFFDGEKASDVLPAGWPNAVSVCDPPVAISNTVCMLFVPPTAMRSPLGKNATVHVGPILGCWFCQPRTSVPAARSHNLTVLSSPPDAASFPSGEMAMLRTSPVWPTNERISVPSSTFQSRIVFSAPAERTLRPSGIKATL